MATITTTSAETTAVDVPRIGITTMIVPIRGTSPLLVHRFSEKAKRQMLDAQQGRKNKKETRDPEADYEASFYRFDDPVTGEKGYGFPVIAFKAATISAARLFDKSVTMVGLRQQLFFSGIIGDDGQQLAIIEGEPVMREDVVRVGMGGTDLRYRPMFAEWSTRLEVKFVASVISAGSVLSLIDAGGLTVGVGEWRPEKKGDFGQYEINGDVEVIA